MTPPSYLFDYRPCNYFKGDVVCDSISIEEIRRVFHQTIIPVLDSITLILRPSISGFIPSNILSNKRTPELSIQFNDGSQNSSINWQVDTEAFRYTKNYTKTFRVNFMDCAKLNFRFLAGFDKLNNLTFSNILNIHNCFPTLPPLLILSHLAFHNCTGIDELYNFPTLVTDRLKTVAFVCNESNIKEVWNDTTVNRVMNWLLISSAETLEEITFKNMKQLTKIPIQIQSFNALNKLNLNNNGISTVVGYSLSFFAPVLNVDLGNNQIKTIGKNAFNGKTYKFHF